MTSSQKKKSKQQSIAPKESTPVSAKKKGGFSPLMAGLIIAAALLAVVAGLRLLPRASLEEKVEAMISSEELLLAITPELKRLNKSAMNLDLPDHRSLGLFADKVRVTDVDGGKELETIFRLATYGLEIREWPVSGSDEVVPSVDLSFWAPVLSQIDYFEHAKFYFVDSDYLKPQQEEWECKIGFHGLARLQSGIWSDIHAKNNVVWRKDHPEAEGAAAWRISEWELLELKTHEVSEFPFADVLKDAVDDEDLYNRARHSIHEDLVTEFLFDIENPVEERTFEMPHKYFMGPAQDRHPGIAVVDVDGDELDDIYIMARWGKNILFHNRGDGTFEDLAANLGLDIQDHSSSAIFADFDNDGDQDLFLGRTMERSQYLVNEDGRFIDRSGDLINVELPYLASAITAADYNNDGLLDLYVSTYASHTMRNDFESFGGPYLIAQSGNLNQMARLLSDFLSIPDQERLHNLVTLPKYDYHYIRNSYGPPNMLLRNTGGGRFVEARDVPELRLFRHTYQATWADYDNDGDPDIYLANDFAPNNLFRNEGNGRFVDVTAETETADIGFGMGVSWGDYDGDGRQDFYISNMFSKAGKRITRKIPGINPTFSAMAKGNSLFRNTGKKFEKVSGTEEGTVQVEAAGWSWGGQFADFDNDGWLDIYSLSGHYTIPHVIESQVDI